MAATQSLFARSLDPGSPRARMLLGVTRAVAEKGYAAATVSDVVRIAAVSRRTFYEQFTDKEDCFLEAYRAGTEIVIADILEALREFPDEAWRARVTAAIGAFTRTLASEPDFARVFFVDVLGAGPRAVEERRRSFDLFAANWRFLVDRAERQEETIGRVPDLVLHALVGAIAELVLRHILSDGAASLPELTPALSELSVRVIENAG